MNNTISSNHCYEKCCFPNLTNTLASVLTSPEGNRKDWKNRRVTEMMMKVLTGLLAPGKAALEIMTD